MRILNLGAGVQSTTLFLMSREGVIPPVDHAIFADTQEEPEAVYQHLAWLRTLPAPVPLIHVGTIGRMGDHLLAETGPNQPNGSARHPHHRHRHASIPAFSLGGRGDRGMLPRQCTREYKIDVVERIIRREIYGIKPRQRMPKGASVKQLFGISWDERNRSVRIRCRLEKTKHSRAEFPLIDMRLTREDCQEWLRPRVPHETPRSACVFCPFKSPEEWERTRAVPNDWARAVEVDAGLRLAGSVANRGMDAALYVHRQCVPLPMVDLVKEADRARERKSTPLFDQLRCDDGLCGL